MRVVQEPDLLDARAIRVTAFGLVFAVLLCSAGAAAILQVSIGALAPAGFVAGRQAQTLREIAAIELGIFSTQTGRGERGTERPGASPVSRQPLGTPALLPLEAALRAYVAGERPRRPHRDPSLDPAQVQPGALP